MASPAGTAEYASAPLLAPAGYKGDGSKIPSAAGGSPTIVRSRAVAGSTRVGEGRDAPQSAAPALPPLPAVPAVPPLPAPPPTSAPESTPPPAVPALGSE